MLYVLWTPSYVSPFWPPSENRYEHGTLNSDQGLFIYLDTLTSYSLLTFAVAVSNQGTRIVSSLSNKKRVTTSHTSMLLHLRCGTTISRWQCQYSSEAYEMSTSPSPSTRVPKGICWPANPSSKVHPGEGSSKACRQVEGNKISSKKKSGKDPWVVRIERESFRSWKSYHPRSFPWWFNNYTPSSAPWCQILIKSKAKDIWGNQGRWSPPQIGGAREGTVASIMTMIMTLRSATSLRTKLKHWSIKAISANTCEAVSSSLRWGE